MIACRNDKGPRLVSLGGIDQPVLVPSRITQANRRFRVGQYDGHHLLNHDRAAEPDVYYR